MLLITVTRHTATAGICRELRSALGQAGRVGAPTGFPSPRRSAEAAPPQPQL